MMSNYIGNNFIIIGSRVIIDGKEVPPVPGRRKNHNSVTSVDGALYVDGYEWVNGQWRKTFRAWWHKWF